MNWQPIRVFPGTFGIPTAKLTREQWVATRKMVAKDGIGGSEMGVFLNDEDSRKFNSPIRMYYDRLGLWERKDSDNQYAFQGRETEELINTWWKHWDTDWPTTMQRITSKSPTRKSAACNYIVKNPKYPHIFANIDRRIIYSPDAPKQRGKKKGILECKSIAGHTADKYELGFPDRYILQPQQYMLITEVEYAELGVLTINHKLELAVYPITPSQGARAFIIDQSEAFMSSVVRGREALAKLPANATMEQKMQVAQEFEPIVRNGDDEYGFLSEKARLKESKQIIELPDEVLEWYLTYNNYKDTYDAAAEQMQGIKNKVRQKMIQDDVYQYRLDNRAAITNGKRFIIK